MSLGELITLTNFKMCHPFTNSRYHSTWFMSKDHGCCEDKISNSSLLPVMHIWTTDPNCMHLNLHLYSLSKKSISKFLTCNLRKKINFKHWSIIWKMYFKLRDQLKRISWTNLTSPCRLKCSSCFACFCVTHNVTWLILVLVIFGRSSSVIFQ